MTPATDSRKVWVVVGDLSSLLLQTFNDCQRRRFAQIVDILFVCKTEHEDPGSPQRDAVPVERRSDRLHHKLRHGAVHFTRKFNEPGMEVPFASFPAQVKRIDRDTVTT